MKLSDLTPVEYNPRSITPERMAKLKAALIEHSEAAGGSSSNIKLANTITINKNGNRIIGGNQRVTALIELGQEKIHKDDITWVKLEPGSAKEKALCVSLNNPHAGGEWDEDKLETVLAEMLLDIPDVFDDLSLGDLQLKDDEIDFTEDVNLDTQNKKMCVCPKCGFEYE